MTFQSCSTIFSCDHIPATSASLYLGNNVFILRISCRSFLELRRISSEKKKYNYSYSSIGYCESMLVPSSLQSADLMHDSPVSSTVPHSIGHDVYLIMK